MTAANPIKFGTDGWRAVIADQFTYAQVQRVAQASARVLAKTFTGSGIVIGYDNRFLSEKFARSAAEAVAALGMPVKLSTCAAPTPAFSWAANQLGLHGALVITASHNPPEYSGIKIKGAFGGSVTADVTRQVEAILEELPAAVESSDASAVIEDGVFGEVDASNRFTCAYMATDIGFVDTNEVGCYSQRKHLVYLRNWAC